MKATVPRHPGIQSLQSSEVGPQTVVVGRADANSNIEGRETLLGNGSAQQSSNSRASVASAKAAESPELRALMLPAIADGKVRRGEDRSQSAAPPQYEEVVSTHGATLASLHTAIANLSALVDRPLTKEELHKARYKPFDSPRSKAFFDVASGGDTRWNRHRYRDLGIDSEMPGPAFFIGSFCLYAPYVLSVVPACIIAACRGRTERTPLGSREDAMARQFQAFQKELKRFEAQNNATDDALVAILSDIIALEQRLKTHPANRLRNNRHFDSFFYQAKRTIDRMRNAKYDGGK